MNELTATNSNELIQGHNTAEAGAVANQTAGNHLFVDFISCKSKNTIRAHSADFTAFCTFLGSVGIDCPSADALQTDPQAWAGITWGLVQSFVK